MDEPPAGQRVHGWIAEHGAAVRGYLRHLVRRSEVADDLWQEVFRRAWEARDGYTEQGQARAYLLQIADRLACDHFRRQGREVQLAGDDWRHVEPAGDDDPQRLAIESETVRRLCEALDELSPGQRRVLLLRFYGGCEFQRIAEIVNAPLNTVLSHCRRGLAQLRRRLEEQNDDQ